MPSKISSWEWITFRILKLEFNFKFSLDLHRILSFALNEVADEHDVYDGHGDEDVHHGGRDDQNL